MQAEMRRWLTTAGALVGAFFLGAMAASPAWTDEKKPQPLDLLLTRSELAAVVRNYEIKTGENHTAPFDDEEILVIAPGYLAPMRDPSQDVGGGLFAPFWAIRHPKDAWRIFAPIPPKGPSPKTERPAPDPR